MARPIQLPDKLFFRIGEVAALVGVRPHVLRYWEQELGVLRPMKTRGAHRQYRRRDVELALVIKRMVQVEGLTLGGVKKRLRELGHLGAPLVKEAAPQAAPIATPASREVALRGELLALRGDLLALLGRLDALGADVRSPTPRERAAPVVVVESVRTPTRER